MHLRENFPYLNTSQDKDPKMNTKQDKDPKMNTKIWTHLLALLSPTPMIKPAAVFFNYHHQ